MKKKLCFIAAIAASALACNKVPEIPVVEVFMTEFGFTVEGNQNFLSRNVFVECTSSTVNVVLPYGTDENAVKGLTPSFTVTEGATVTVGDQIIQSNVSLVDFTYPVEFLVSVNEKSNALYTVTVSISGPEAFAFAAKSAESETINEGPFLAVNPKDNLPYFGVVARNDDSALRYGQIFHYEDGQISKLCDVTSARTSQPTLSFLPDGTPYYACYDNSSAHAQVYVVNGVTPAAVGAVDVLYKPLTNATYSTMGLLPLASDEVYLGYGVAAVSGGLAKRALNLAKFDGAAWTQEKTIDGRPVGNAAYETYGKIVGDAGYLFIFNQNVHSLSLYKFTKGSIETVFEGISFTTETAAEEGTTVKTHMINLYGLDFDIASNGDPYFVVAVEGSSTSGSGYAPAVYRYDTEEKVIEMVGGGVLSDIDVAAARHISLALDADDRPYLAYRNPTTKAAEYTYVDAKTKVWAAAQALSADEADFVKIQFAENGTGYISYDDATTHQIVLYKSK